MLHAFPIEPDAEEDPGEPVDPVLEPYARLEAPGSYYVSAMALFPTHRGKGLGTRMLEISRQKARQSGYGKVSLLVFGQNERAVRLYEREGFGVIKRAAIVPHEKIRYTGDVLLMTAPA